MRKAFEVPTKSQLRCHEQRGLSILNRYSVYSHVSHVTESWYHQTLKIPRKTQALNHKSQTLIMLFIKYIILVSVLQSRRQTPHLDQRILEFPSHRWPSPIHTSVASKYDSNNCKKPFVSQAEHRKYENRNEKECIRKDATHNTIEYDTNIYIYMLIPVNLYLVYTFMQDSKNLQICYYS